MHRPIRRRAAAATVTAGLLAAGLLVSVVGVAPADAVPLPTAPSAATPSCVVSLGLTATPTTRCYASFGAALAAATGGTLTAAPARAPGVDGAAALDAQIDAANRTNAPTRAGTLIGIEYFDRDYQGFSWVVTTPAGCQSDVWQLDQLGDYDNQISSFRNYAQCETNHFDGRYAGPRTGPQQDRRYIGDKLNDRASSIRWT